MRVVYDVETPEVREKFLLMTGKRGADLPSMVLGWAVKMAGSTTNRVLSTMSVTLSPSLSPLLRCPSLPLRSYT